MKRISLLWLGLLWLAACHHSQAQSLPFTVQVKAVADSAAAEALVGQLRGQGLEAYYVKATVPGKGHLYRVRVGQFTTASAARQAGQALARAGLIDEFFIAAEERPLRGAQMAEVLSRYRVTPQFPSRIYLRPGVAAGRFAGLGGSPSPKVAPAAGGDHPKAELYVGYAFTRIDTNTDRTGIPAVNLHGWIGSISGNPKPWLGLVADFSGAYGSPSVTVQGIRFDTDYRVHSFLFGPRFYIRREQVSAFVHTLFGVVRADLKSSVASGTVTSTSDDSAFGAAFGSGLDVKLTNKVWLRVIQADYLLTRFKTVNRAMTGLETGNQHNLRLSAGLVFRVK